MEDVDALVNRKGAIQKRLSEINGSNIPVEDVDNAIVRQDVHWDFVLKEMVCVFVFIWDMYFTALIEVVS